MYDDDMRAHDESNKNQQHHLNRVKSEQQFLHYRMPTLKRFRTGHLFPPRVATHHRFMGGLARSIVAVLLYSILTLVKLLTIVGWPAGAARTTRRARAGRARRRP